MGTPSTGLIYFCPRNPCRWSASVNAYTCGIYDETTFFSVVFEY